MKKTENRNQPGEDEDKQVTRPDEPVQPESIYYATGYTSLYSRIKDEIIDTSTEAEAGVFDDSHKKAGSGNYLEAAQSIKSLALSGNVYAQMLLYEYYNRLDQSKEAIMWLQRASKKHHPFADFLLGAAYIANSEGLGRTVAEGQALLVKGAKKGLVDAQYVLGMWGINSYRKSGDQRQYDMGVRMLRMAAKQNYQPAISMLKGLGAYP